jgi:ABC-type iron transport system FetAB ATPase subunit
VPDFSEKIVPNGLVTKGLRSDYAGPFDLTVAKGACVAITGPSGSGKSLLLRMIADLDPNLGEAWLDDHPRAAMSGPDWRRQATYVAAESGWWSDLVSDHFVGIAADAIDYMAKRLSVREALLSAPVAQLSTGEKQRLALMRGLLQRPKLLLLDEPTAALDESSVTFAEFLLQAFRADGGTVVLVTHDPRQAQRLGTRHFRMAAGRLEEA